MYNASSITGDQIMFKSALVLALSLTATSAFASSYAEAINQSVAMGADVFNAVNGAAQQSKGAINSLANTLNGTTIGQTEQYVDGKRVDSNGQKYGFVYCVPVVPNGCKGPNDSNITHGAFIYSKTKIASFTITSRKFISTPLEPIMVIEFSY